LIELMIVVGIIGILVAIAAPNFARYQSKARQSEAKIALSAVYAGLKSFYSKYSAYTPSMDAIGYEPEGDKRFYAVGWQAGTPGLVSGYAGAQTTPAFGTINTPAWICTGTTALGSLQALPTGADLQVITVGAAGSIRQDVGCDIWTIDDTKTLRNTTVSL
jgi:type IV pilus assembly protein PilA